MPEDRSILLTIITGTISILLANIILELYIKPRFIKVAGER